MMVALGLVAADHSEILEMVEQQGLSAQFYWPPEALEPELRYADGVVAKDSGGRIQAFILWRTMGAIHEITCLATRSESLRMGVMKQLMAGLLQKHRDATWLLEVHENNTAARALYESLGFERAGVRRGYYRDGKDAYLLQWSRGNADKPLP